MLQVAVWIPFRHPHLPSFSFLLSKQIDKPCGGGGSKAQDCCKMPACTDLCERAQGRILLFSTAAPKSQCVWLLSQFTRCDFRAASFPGRMAWKQSLLATATLGPTPSAPHDCSDTVHLLGYAGGRLLWRRLAHLGQNVCCLGEDFNTCYTETSSFSCCD